MDFTQKFLVDFIKNLSTLNKSSSSYFHGEAEESAKQIEKEKAALQAVRDSAKSVSDKYAATISSFEDDYRDNLDKIIAEEKNNKIDALKRLQLCKIQLAAIEGAQKSISSQEAFSSYLSGNAVGTAVNIDSILQGKVNFVERAREINEAMRFPKQNKDLPGKCTAFDNICKQGTKLLTEEIKKLRIEIGKNREDLHNSYEATAYETHSLAMTSWTEAGKELDEIAERYAAQKASGAEDTIRSNAATAKEMQGRLNNLTDSFCKKFPPEDLFAEYKRLYSLEPSFDNYECYNEMPKNIHISAVEYNLSPLELNDFTKSFLKQKYFFMFRDNKLSIPYCATFNSEFNYLFKFNGDGSKRQLVVDDACALGMRLFMMLPPGKVNFTFIDPVKLGESFAMFMRLVDVDDRTSAIINGKIWSAPDDIESKLKIMTDHISNVTQRFLQGKYDNIYEYNKVAEQNAEAYQILMIMDFPAGLTDRSLKLLEQIVTSGPKCGVFTVIYRDETQFTQVQDRSKPLVSNIETNLSKFVYSDNCKTVEFEEKAYKGNALQWMNLALPAQSQLDDIIAILKKAIKNAEKVVIGIDKVKNAEITESTKDGIRIPIGIRGANEVQYLTLGVGGSHHALIAGVAGSGKSSLLHTIILRTLMQYKANTTDEISIYLVDFKRGVEFKIYADYVLPAFKVVAIESEREFGYNILLALEREQKIRANLFKRARVDKIEEYRDEDGKKMPRILVIMDEFHELFSNSNDEFSKKSAIIMERIVRQGRAFGVHLILASQSYSNITGIDRAVFDQMAVRIVLKCSSADANLLLDNGSTEIDQISIDDPGRAVYNSEAGNKEFNSHFRVAYIEPSQHRRMLEEISSETVQYADLKHPTRILLSNIEDNNYSIFNQFNNYDPRTYDTPRRFYIGEPLGVDNYMAMDFNRTEYSNMLMIGDDTEKARSMFAFGIMSLCINYWIIHRKAPETPFITLFNCKPLNDSYFTDTPYELSKQLPQYIQYIACGDEKKVNEILPELHELARASSGVDGEDRYFFVFGYQRAEELKSEIKLSQNNSNNIDELFNIMSDNDKKPDLSPKEMFSDLIKSGAQKGIHVVLWQDSFNALYQDDKDIVSYFAMKIAFDMTPEEYSRFVGANDVSLMSENNAIYYNRAMDNQTFRPYQAPDDDWMQGICDKLKAHKDSE